MRRFKCLKDFRNLERILADLGCIVRQGREVGV
jgi:hypothetical protein